ncbi:MAG: hypothetical protein ACOCZ9_02875, partial [Spirochaetota bacterium]
MNLNGDRDRFLIAFAAAIVFHIGLVIGLTFVDWSSPPRSTTLTVDLGAPVETDVPEVDPELLEEESEEPQQPEDPDEIDDPEDPEEPEEPEPEDSAPAETEAAPDQESPDAADAEAPSDQDSGESQPPSEPPPPQGPSEDEVAGALGQLGMDDSDEERERAPRSRSEPAPSEDSDEYTQRREEAREEFERLLAEEEKDRRRAAGNEEDADAEAGGDPDTEVSASVLDRLRQVRDAPTDPSAPPGSGDSGDTTDDDNSRDDSGGGNDDPDDPGEGEDIVTWDGDGDRALIEYSVPEMDGSDLRASGAPEVRARIEFRVDERGIVMPGSVTLNAPGLSPGGSEK